MSNRRGAAVHGGQLRRHPGERCSRASCSGTCAAPSPARKTARAGRFAAADGGTIFLDEIGEMPLGLQAKLLRVLQEKEVTPLGETKSRKIDVRVIAATNRDLDEMVRSARFREDLLYRLNVIPIELPALRDRKSDIPELVRALHHSAPTSAAAAPSRASIRARWSCCPPTTGRATFASWRTRVERAVLLKAEGELAIEDLPEKLRTPQPRVRRCGARPGKSRCYLPEGRST